MNCPLKAIPLLIIVLLAAGACERSLSTPVSDLSIAEDMTRQDLRLIGPPDLTTDGPDLITYRGRCYGAPGTQKCSHTYECGDGIIADCKEGRCCAGELDAVTCECHCNGGPECSFGMFCCKGDESWMLADQGALKCRFAKYCRPRL